MAMNKYLSIITLNINGLNAPIKRHTIAKWIRKHDHTYAASKRPTSEQKTYTNRKVKGWKQIFQKNGKERKPGVTILLSDKRDFKTKA